MKVLKSGSMANLDRRSFNRLLGTAAAAGLVSSVGSSFAAAKGKTRARVVIIGGGAGGGTVAHLIRKNARKIDVTLVEPNSTYTSCFFSNQYIGGFRSMESIQHNYDGLKKLGVNIVHDFASSIDSEKKVVSLKDGEALPYDKLVLSPGVDMNYEAIEGYSEDVARIMPHAWETGDQTHALRRQLLDMKDGGTVLISVPGNPYRCPSAPYERATLIAHYLKHYKPASKLIILDTKSLFPRMELFEEAWSGEYKGLVEWIPGDKHGGVVKVLANEMSLVTRNGDKMKADVVNVIPPQKASMIAVRAGCTEGDWCPIVPDSFASRLVKDVFVLGDAATARNMPKSASSAHSQAQIVANAIAAQLTGKKMFPPRYRNTCWSLLATNNAIKSGASYVAGKDLVEQRTSFKSDVKEDKEIRAGNFRESLKWYDEITADIFAKG